MSIKAFTEFLIGPSIFGLLIMSAIQLVQVNYQIQTIRRLEQPYTGINRIYQNRQAGIRNHAFFLRFLRSSPLFFSVLSITIFVYIYAYIITVVTIDFLSLVFSEKCLRYYSKELELELQRLSRRLTLLIPTNSQFLLAHLFQVRLLFLLVSVSNLGNDLF